MSTQGAAGVTWVLRALLVVGGGILVALVTAWSAAPAHAEPTPDPLVAAVTAMLSDAPAPVVPAVAGAVVQPVLAPVVDAVAAPVTDAVPAIAPVAGGGAGPGVVDVLAAVASPAVDG